MFFLPFPRARTRARIILCTKRKNMKKTLAQLIEKLHSENTRLREENAGLTASVASLKETVAYLQRMLFGQKSERVVADSSQPFLPGMEPSPNAEGKAPEKETVVSAHKRKCAGQQKAGWNEFPANLPREEMIVDWPEEKKQGRVFKGYAISERLVYRGAYVVMVVKRAQYDRLEGAEYGVETVPAPALPSCLSQSSDRCHYDISVYIHVIVQKLVEHNPFYRQEQMFARMGIQFGRSAMCDAFAKVSDALKPLYDRLVFLVMLCEILHADETHVDMLDPGTGRAKCCWIWVRKTGLGPPMTVFYFSLDRSTDTAVEILGDYRGTILRDGYIVYGNLPADAAGCWAHCRRKFFEAQSNHPEYAMKALELIRALYANEAEARSMAELRSGETALFKERARFRKLSRPVVDQYFALCRQIIDAEPPSSQIAKAANYSAVRETELRKFLDNPKLNIDNNPCENVIRPFCLGRKNWLFVGNHGGGTSMAILASFAATCKDNNIDFEKWLADVLVRLDTTPADQLDTLLPVKWPTEKN